MIMSLSIEYQPIALDENQPTNPLVEGRHQFSLALIMMYMLSFSRVSPSQNDQQQQQ